MSYAPHNDHRRHKKGVILINLGTPSAPTAKAVKRYLKEFLTDRRVIELPLFLWKIILYGIILPIRSKKSAANYAKIWDKTHNDSPLRYYLKSLQAKLSDQFKDELIISAGMRYGEPSLQQAVDELLKQQVGDITLLPLYPQYCAATTASAQDKFFDILLKMRWQPNFKVIGAYYDHPLYISTISNHLKSHLDSLKQPPDLIICSFHGMPKRTLELGDPYYCHAHKTARLIKESLKLDDDLFKLGFQSRFGPAKWLEPSIDQLLADAIQKKLKHIVMIAPGFSFDCVETLEEISIGYREDFMEAGGVKFDYIPCLNDTEDAVSLYAALIKETSRNAG